MSDTEEFFHDTFDDRLSTIRSLAQMLEGELSTLANESAHIDPTDPHTDELISAESSMYSVLVSIENAQVAHNKRIEYLFRQLQDAST